MGALPPEPKLVTEKDGTASLGTLKRGYLRMKRWGRIGQATAKRLQAHIRDVEATKKRCFDGSPALFDLPANFDILANLTVTGSGDYLVDEGTGRPAVFSSEFAPGMSERWFRPMNALVSACWASPPPTS